MKRGSAGVSTTSPSTWASLALALVALAACSEPRVRPAMNLDAAADADSTHDGGLQDARMPSQDAAPDLDASAVARVAGPLGAAIEVPHGAIVDVTLSVELDSANAAPPLLDEHEKVGPVFAFLPHGVAFDRPVTVEIPLVNGVSHPVLITAQVGGSWEVVPSTVRGETLVAEVTHFSFFTIVEGASNVDEDAGFLDAGSGSFGGDGGVDITVFQLGARSNPMDLVVGPDGNFWVAEWGTSRLGRVTPAGEVTHFALPWTASNSALQPRNVAIGADGAVWFEGFPLGTMAEGQPALLPTPSGWPRAQELSSMVRGPGGDLWAARGSSAVLARFDAAGELVHEYVMPERVTGLAHGADGSIWFTQFFAVGRMTPDGAIDVFPTAVNPGWDSLVSTPAGNLWFVDASALCRVTLQGAVTCFNAPAGHSPLRVVAGADGTIWFGGSRTISVPGSTGAFVGRMNVDGNNLEVFDLPESVSLMPQAMVLGPDGNVWYADRSLGTVARIVPLD